jgi:endonuclease/exonuclease/phosphatase family metal-dependent hydrolase
MLFRKRIPLRLNVLVILVMVLVGAAWFYLFNVGMKHLTPQKRGANVLPGRFTDTLTVMSYNVENLFDMVDDGTEYPEFKPNHCNWNDYTFQIRVRNVATVIASAKPDIAVLYEVENGRSLEALRTALAGMGREYKYAAIADRPNQTGTCPAMLSRFPIAFSAGIGTLLIEKHFTRNILEAHILIGRDSLVVFANHWPSRKFAESQRVAVATILAGRLRQLEPGTDYLIAGDLNEDYNECEVFYSEGFDDTKGLTAVNHVLGTVASRPYDPVRFRFQGERGQPDAIAHYDPWAEIPDEQRGSHRYQGQWATIDHFLLPPSLFDSTGISYIPNSFAVFTMHDSLLRDGAPFGWQMAYGGPCPSHKGEGYSDNLPIMARFYCGPSAARSTGGPDFSGRTAPARDTVRPVLIGFETGYEGWVGEAPGVQPKRDTVNVHGGRQSLRIAGAARNENITAARLVIPAPRLAGRRTGTLSFYVKGSAGLCFRMRSAGSKKWFYFVGPERKEAGAAKYSPMHFSDWTRIRLPLAGIYEPGKGLEFELRAAKKSDIKLWIDDIDLN